MTKGLSLYPIHIYWSDEDEGYIAIAPDLPGCSSYGQSRQEALENSIDAIEAWLEASADMGRISPPPTLCPKP